MERKYSPPKIARSRWAPRGIAAGVGFVGLVTLLMVVAPFAGASTPKTWAPPYKGFTSTTSNSLYSYGCTAYAHESAVPAWSATTGTFSMAGKISAGRCISGFSYASIYGQTIITSPTFYRTHSGYTWLYISWNLAVVAKAALSVSSGTGNGNFSYANASVLGSVYAYIVDVTNGSYLSGASATLFGASFTSTGHYLLSTTASTSYLYLWGALQKGHQYQVLLYLDAGVTIYFYNVSATASASLNLAGTHGLTLTGITLY
jgi:hypothetical protein